jgi:hypothetical protein
MFAERRMIARRRSLKESTTTPHQQLDVDTISISQRTTISA